MTSRPDYHETTRATDSMNTEADQNPQIVSKRHICSDDLDPDNLKWPTWPSHTWKWLVAVHRHSKDLDSTQLFLQKWCKNHLRETVQLLRKKGLRRQMIGGMHQGGPISLGGRVQDGLGFIFSRFSHPDVFCVSHSDGGVRTQVVVTTVCAPGVYTLLSHAHVLCIHMAQGELSLKKGLWHCACLLFISPSPTLMFHAASLLFPDGHSTNTIPVLHLCRVLPAPKSRCMRTPECAARSLAIWQLHRLPHGLAPMSVFHLRLLSTTYWFKKLPYSDRLYIFVCDLEDASVTALNFRRTHEGFVQFQRTDLQ